MGSIKITCPYCKNIIDVDMDSSKEQNMKCYICNKVFTIIQYENKNSKDSPKLNVVKLNDNETNDSYESLPYPLLKIQPFNIYVYSLLAKIIGLIFIVSGAYLIVEFLNQNLNLGTAFVIIGISSFFLTSEIKNPQKGLVMQLLTSEKITIIFTLWIFIALLLTNQYDFDSYLITLIIGFLVIKEITRSQITEEIDKRMKIFIIAFFLVFLMIIGDKIIATFFN